MHCNKRTSVRRISLKNHRFRVQLMYTYLLRLLQYTYDYYIFPRVRIMAFLGNARVCTGIETGNVFTLPVRVQARLNRDNIRYNIQHLLGTHNIHTDRAFQAEALSRGTALTSC